MPISPEQLSKSGTEAAHQKALMAWAALNVGKYPQLKWLFHVPNGGSRDIREGANLKAQGVKRGVPDLALMFPARGCHGLFIELKIAGGKVSDEQQLWIDNLNINGYRALVAFGWLQAKGYLEAYLNGE